jgi:hypothetical protein
MDDDRSKTYFELVTEPPVFMEDFAACASKTYARGLVVIMIYVQGTFYVVMEDGEGDQPLLVGCPQGWTDCHAQRLSERSVRQDIRFPDVSQHGQGELESPHSPVGQPISS